jgi:cephalosporin hydroxylase
MINSLLNQIEPVNIFISISCETEFKNDVENIINSYESKHDIIKFQFHSQKQSQFEHYKNNAGIILEIGVQYGGSSLLWHEYLPKFKIVMTDILNQVHPIIWDKMNKNRYEYINMDSFKIECINTLKVKYPEGFDIIIEDGPHTLESQIFTIKEYPKLLKDGGILVIEDIQKFEYCEIILNEINKEDFKSVEIIDLRKNKNRYDDILIVVKK